MIIKHYCTINEYSKIEKAMEELKIEFAPKSIGVAFYMSDDDPRFVEIEKLINAGLINSIPATAEYIYSEEEFEDAEWFAIRSKHHWSYPHPENKYRQETYNAENYCEKCGQGLIQKTAFRMKKEPQWGRNNFMHLHWVYDELFMNSKILDGFIAQGFTGFTLEDVKLKSSSEILKTVKQIKIENELGLGMLFGASSQILKCEKCGKTKTLLGWEGVYQFKEETFSSASHDIYKGSEAFGDGLIAAHKIIVSKRMIRYIIDQGFKEISYRPIQLI